MNSQRPDLAEAFLALLEKPAPLIDLPVQANRSNGNWKSAAAEIIDFVRDKRPDLWNGDCIGNGRYRSQSEADYALTGLIVRKALMQGVSKEDLESLTRHIFRQSKLYRQTKWRTVITQTIPKIIQSELQKNSLLDQEIEPVTTSLEPQLNKLFDGLILSEAHVEEMKDAKFIIQDLIVLSHMMAIVAPANSGKTALLVHFSQQIARAGYRLYYINCDASPSDLKRHFSHSKSNNYTLIAPDALLGKSPTDVLSEFRRWLDSGIDLSDVVIILDTLKKFVDVIEKRAAKELYRLLRALTVRGCTIILLGHCNKHPDRDGRSVYEGTGDLRNDLDELLYLDAQMDEAKSALRVTTRPDKVRADIKPRSFLIHLPDRRVEELDKPFRIIPKVELEILDLAADGIWLENTSQKDLVEFILQRVTSHAGEKKIKEVLARHAQNADRIMVRRSGRAKDLVYSLTSEEWASKKAQDELVKNSPF
jgi:hypothetical protein